MALHRHLSEDCEDISELPVHDLAMVLNHVELALRDEGMPTPFVDRVRNRLLYGHPDGANAVVRLDPDTQRTVVRP